MSATANQSRPDPVKAHRDKQVRSMITPEGIDLRLRLADGGARLGAFTIDLIIMILTLILFTLMMAFIAARMGWDNSEFAVVIWILGAFLLRNFYFMFFEMGRKAATPGKRLVKIRVAARNGGRLTANAIFVRNAMRELEFFLPLGFVLSGGSGENGWALLCAVVWSFIFLFFPLFNKDKLRGGDLIAGTWVVEAPRQVLSKDLSAPEAEETQSLYRFSPTQVDAYGVKELHVLETVLRKNDPETLKEVSERIIKKIEWPGEENITTRAQRRAFLNAYYAALRGKLETKLLFGVRRTDKFDKR